MDPSKEFQKEMEYYQYLEKQRENYVDLTNSDNSVLDFANVLFNKPIDKLDNDQSRILFDNCMEVIDLFCFLVELVLYGLNIIHPNASIFDINESENKVIEEMKCYFKSIGIMLIVREDFIDSDVKLYRDRDDYYCEILKKPPPQFCHAGWYVLNYRLIDNNKFNFEKDIPLEKFKAFFISEDQKIFNIKFKIFGA